MRTPYWLTKEAVPYNEIDPAMVKLCREINKFPGIVTTESCQGYIDGHRLEVEEWNVFISPQSAGGAMPHQTRCSLQFLIWLVNGPEAAELDTHIDVWAPAPWLNGPDSCITYMLTGYDTHPDQLADVIRDYREKYFTLSGYNARRAMISGMLHTPVCSCCGSQTHLTLDEEQLQVCR